MTRSKKITDEEISSNQPPSLHGRAIDNLAFIRDAIERSTEFTAVSGYGGALMGLTAIIASLVAANTKDQRSWLLVWLIEALIAFSIGLLSMWNKSRITRTSLASTPARKFAYGLMPPLIAGVAITYLLLRNNHFAELPPTWLILYGTAVVTGGSYSVSIVPIMGWCFITLGVICVFFPGYGNTFLGFGFGGMQVVFGLVIARKHGG